MEAGAPVSEEKQDHANPDCIIHCPCSHEESQLPPPIEAGGVGRTCEYGGAAITPAYRGGSLLGGMIKRNGFPSGSAGRPEMKCSGLFNAGTGLPF